MKLFAKFAALAALLGLASSPTPAPPPRPVPAPEPRPELVPVMRRRRPRRFSRAVRSVLVDQHHKASEDRSRGIPPGANRAAWQAVNRRPAW